MKKYYFVAIVAPASVNEKAQQMKEDLFLRFGTKAALKAPVHITLFSPFNFDPAEESQLTDALSSCAKGIFSFDVKLENFSCFPPRVLFINVIPSEELKRIHTAVVNGFMNVRGMKKANEEKNFHPHMTIGNRDWKEVDFHQAWDDYKNRTFMEIFIADCISLLRLDEGRWKIISESFL
ncbi:MAG: RNA 2',3'-cyclic phosphodiesterase [Bacteroidetes bacterium]|nr:RNA 2',3'-cyclic phosphodiesterase [Bacteroidota bacterium]